MTDEAVPNIKTLSKRSKDRIRQQKKITLIRSMSTRTFMQDEKNSTKETCS